MLWWEGVDVAVLCALRGVASHPLDAPSVHLLAQVALPRRARGMPHRLGLLVASQALQEWRIDGEAGMARPCPLLERLGPQGQLAAADPVHSVVLRLVIAIPGGQFAG
eukprot:CAMPEP_0185320992 /NCGR_PEP_ID=MMETSP1363-20130426/56083_1 /TAXON_ID=38817 /ORGANISM="Gephyrocapsa oceanica, Strain RCC1303" /LENGTH=107 /DNA_ID=CAMNT_0027919457 /DNA_START=66 /DNA_END=386 /DNA_ORIENTATION=-